MAKLTQTYTTLRPFPHHGRVIPTGDAVELYPSQAKYYLGSHLAEFEPAPAKTPKSKPASKADDKPTTTEGDQ